MRKIIVQLAISLDGYIEGSKGEYDWCFTDQDYGMNDFLNSIDIIIYGRKSYELLLKTGDTTFQKYRTIVYSTQKHLNFEGAEIWSDATGNQLTELKQTSGKDIWFFGGAELLSRFFANNWVDELRLAVHPTLLGSGKPLFQNISERKYLRLKHVQSYSSGLVMLTYEKC
jgi:dihydrofolate reductase